MKPEALMTPAVEAGAPGTEASGAEPPGSEMRDGVWWPQARRVISPNQDARPEGARVELVVLHAISLPPGRYGGGWIERLFTNQINPDADPYFSGLVDLRVSAHFLVARDGAVTQFVPTSARAWHAGVSEWNGRPRCNDFSVGIEFEGCDDEAFTSAQYIAGGRLLAWLWQVEPTLTREAVAHHSAIAPGRKTDPGPFFDDDRLLAAADAASAMIVERDVG